MTITADSVWVNCLKYIKDNVPEDAFHTWFSPIRPAKINGNILTIQVPSKFFYEWLEEHYIKILKSALQRELGAEAKLVYSILMDQKTEGRDPYTVRIPSLGKEKPQPQEVETSMQIDKSKLMNPFVIPGLQKLKIDSQLNPNYTFDNFIEGESNRLARAAGRAIAKRPGGTSFNPLFIYGSVGLGKTHLVHAIGLEVKEIHPDKTVLYVSTEKFTQQFIEAVKNNNQNDFIHFYQMIDVLVMDDIQFLSGKRKTQEVFFHIFNHLHQRGNQIILTSDKSPADIQDMEDRLISRFKWGLSADLQNPDYNTRLDILKQKLEKDGIEFPEEVMDFIAQNIDTNVRELEGSLNSIIAQATLNKREITLELTARTLSKLVQTARKEISIDYIQKTVCEYFKVSMEDIQSKTRKRDVVQARQLAMFFAKQFTKASLASIGSQIGKRDHATVLHACKTVKNLQETDKAFRGYIDDISRKISN